MRQGTIITVPSASNALSVADAKRQLRIAAEDTDEEDHIAALCAAAHQHIETVLGFPILRQTRETHLMQFPPGPVWLGGGAALTVLELRYTDTAGAVQVMPASDYAVDPVASIAKVYPLCANTWPGTVCRPGAVVVKWQAGWNTPADVPADLIHAMKLLVGHWDQNREAVVVGSITNDLKMAVDALLSPFLLRFVA